MASRGRLRVMPRGDTEVEGASLFVLSGEAVGDGELTITAAETDGELSVPYSITAQP